MRLGIKTGEWPRGECVRARVRVRVWGLSWSCAALLRRASSCQLPQDVACHFT